MLDLLETRNRSGASGIRFGIPFRYAFRWCVQLPTPANCIPVKSAISFFHVVMSLELN